MHRYWLIIMLRYFNLVKNCCITNFFVINLIIIITHYKQYLYLSMKNLSNKTAWKYKILLTWQRLTEVQKYIGMGIGGSLQAYRDIPL